MIYFDTSILIKRYIWEPGSEKASGLFEEGASVVTSKVTYAEIYAALTRRKREGHMTSGQYGKVCRLFEREWPAYLIVDLHNEVLRFSKELIQKYPLRGFDAIQLASAKSFSRALKTRMTFACADQRLSECAEKEGFASLAV